MSRVLERRPTALTPCGHRPASACAGTCEISKSGTPILPSKRARKTPEKIQVSNEDLAELSQTAKPDIDTAATDEAGDEQGDLSLDEVTETEDQVSEQETTNESENN